MYTSGEKEARIIVAIQKKLDEAQAARAKVAGDNLDLLRKIDGLREALEKYGNHTFDCHIRHTLWSDENCDCAFIVAQAALAPAVKPCTGPSEACNNYYGKHQTMPCSDCKETK